MQCVYYVFTQRYEEEMLKMLGELMSPNLEIGELYGLYVTVHRATILTR